MLPPQQSSDIPQLVVLAPEAYRGRRIPLDADHLVVGRGPSCDVRFDDPYVSKTHALLQRRGDAVYVRDLNSSAGTLVNGTAAATDRELHLGDMVVLADVVLRLEPAGESVRFEIDKQVAREIDNIAGNKYTYHHYAQRRESFLREVAATRTKARWLVWLGILCYVVGGGLFFAAVIGFISQGLEAIESNDPRPPVDLLGPDIAGIPSGLFGFAVAAVGTVLLMLGIVLHIVATSRRKRIDRDLPAQPQWLVPDQPGGL